MSRAAPVRTWTGLPRHNNGRTLVLHWRDDDPFTRAADATLLPYGRGRSYGDVCLPCECAVICTPLDRIYWFDRTNGTICVEAGIELRELLRVTIAAGWTLPVVPGTGSVTVGGAIANDIHGKSHHWAGTFGRWVRRFELLRSDGSWVCSAEEHPELFAATIGGLGLTGIITWAELQLVPCPSPMMVVESIPFASLEEYCMLATQIEREGNYVVAWCDLAKAGRIRGIISAASWGAEYARQHRAHSGVQRAPAIPPLPLLQHSIVRAANAARYWLNTIFRTRVQHYEQVFFPLDAVPWNRLFGKRGFFQLHAVLPHPGALRSAAELIELLWRARVPIALCVLKNFGTAQSPGLLSFPLHGLSIAVDVPNTPRARSALEAAIDYVCAAGGRIYPAKDALMHASHFQRMYPQWRELERLRDPRCCSRFWWRVTQRS